MNIGTRHRSTVSARVLALLSSQPEAMTEQERALRERIDALTPEQRETLTRALTPPPAELEKIEAARVRRERKMARNARNASHVV